jgi:hypothetical protein
LICGHRRTLEILILPDLWVLSHQDVVEHFDLNV